MTEASMRLFNAPRRALSRDHRRKSRAVCPGNLPVRSGGPFPRRGAKKPPFGRRPGTRGGVKPPHPRTKPAESTAPDGKYCSRRVNMSAFWSALPVRLRLSFIGVFQFGWSAGFPRGWTFYRNPGPDPDFAGPPPSAAPRPVPVRAGSSDRAAIGSPTQPQNIPAKRPCASRGC